MSSLSKKEQTAIRLIGKRLEACKTKIGAERDKMRDLISEYEEIVANADSAYDDLQRAVDTLSGLL